MIFNQKFCPKRSTPVILHGLIFSLLALIVFSSCTPQHKLPKSYLQNVNDTSIKEVREALIPRIKKGDLLTIQVYSASSDPRADIPYNLPTTITEGGIVQRPGILVDDYGNIEYPRIGTINVEGLTKQELADIIKSRFSAELINPTVIVRFQNYRVTVLGEVARPGSYEIPAEQVTILEALGLAGDIPYTGKRENVKVLREENGQMEIGIIDLTSPDLFESPYFHLKQNDVVMVEPTRQRLRQQSDQTTTQRLSLALSIITSIALLYNIFR